MKMHAMWERNVRALAALVLGICVEGGCAQDPVLSPDLPDVPRVRLQPVARMTFAPINESSGLVKSRKWPDVFWTHNDSGGGARIFAIGRDGAVIHPPGVAMDEYRGIAIQGATNIDWEDITADDQGNLIIGACGNNNNLRRDLTLYVVQEPDPHAVVTARAVKAIPFAFPDQTFKKDEPANFDCEAVFFAHGRVYVLTKHRSDRHTKLYRLDETDPDKVNRLTLLDEFDIGGMVTGADASSDGRQSVVLTYNAVWLFDARSDHESRQDDYFGGAIRWLPISAGRCEAICLDGDGLLITNEQRDLFRVSLADLTTVRK